MGFRTGVSLVAYVYNYGDYVAEVLRCVQAQTFSDFELVVVDDGSTDHTAAVVQGCGDPRVRYVRQEHRGRDGLDATFNRCMREARGDLIAVVNGDDHLDPHKIAGQVALFDARPELDVSFHDARFMDAAGAPIEGSFRPALPAVLLEAGRLAPYQFRQNVIPNPTVMFRRRVWDRVGPQEFGWVHDYDFWLRAAAAGCRFHFSPERWIRYRVHERSHSTSSQRAERLRAEAARMRRVRRAELSIQQLYPEIEACRDPRAARVDAHIELGVLLATGAEPMLDLAEAELGQALELAPESALAMHDLGVVELLGGQRERGRRRLETVAGATGSSVALENLRRAESGAAGGFVLVAPDPATSELLERRLQPIPAGGSPTGSAPVVGPELERRAVQALLRS